jgi:hypothetical protein
VAPPVAIVVPEGQGLITDLLSPTPLMAAQQQHRQQVQQRQREQDGWSRWCGCLRLLSIAT